MMGWMAPLRHLGATVLVGREPTSKQGAIHERDYAGWLTGVPRLHRAEADITKPREGSGVDPKSDMGRRSLLRYTPPRQSTLL